MSVSKEDLLKSTPRLLGDLDYSKITLSPKEAFILSRIDGSSKVSEIAKISATNIDDTLTAIIALALKETIDFREFDAKELKPSPPRSTANKPVTAPPSPKAAKVSAAPFQPPAKSQTPPQTASPPPQPQERQPRPTHPPRPKRAARPGPRLIQPLVERPEVKEDLSDLSENGTFAQTSYPETLGKLAIDKVTGILRIKRREGMGYKDIYFRAGVPVFVGGTYMVERECLGQLLKMTGKITDYDLQRSIEMVKEGQQQGEALIELGVINRKMLGSALKWQAELKMAEVFTWKPGEGSYEFYRVGAFAREFNPVDVSVGALILKGVKRGFSFDIVQKTIDAAMENYVIKKSGTELDPYSFNFQLPETRLYEQVIDGNITLAEIIEKAQMDPKQVKQFLYALLITQIIEFRDKPAAGTDEDKIIDDLKARLSLSQKGTYFDGLGIHWTSIGWKVQEGWEKIQRLYGPNSKYQKSGVEDIIKLSSQIYDMGKKSYDVLINDNKRIAYRKEIHNETKLKTSSDLQYQQAESQLLWKEDYKSAVEILESAAELAPNNWIIQASYACALIMRFYPSEREKYSVGEKLLHRTLNAAPSNDIVHFYAGHAYAAMHRTSQARSEFETAVRLNPGNKDAKKALRRLNK